MSTPLNLTPLPKFVLLDCDGTLYDYIKMPDDVFLYALHQASQQLSVSLSEYTLPFVDIPFLKKLMPACFDRLITDMTHNIDYSVLPYNPNLKDAIQQINAHIPVVFATNNVAIHLDRVLKQSFHISLQESGIQCFSIEKMARGETLYNKESGGLEIICEQLQTQPTDFLLIDDNYYTINRAHHIGMKTCVVTSAAETNNALRTLLHIFNQQARF